MTEGNGGGLAKNYLILVILCCKSPGLSYHRFANGPGVVQPCCLIVRSFVRLSVRYFIQAPNKNPIPKQENNNAAYFL